jgi:anaerobic dimethyl sulfoxide reductase subunit A
MRVAMNANDIVSGIGTAGEGPTLGRREFLKFAAACGGGAFANSGPLSAFAAPVAAVATREEFKWANCWAHCHSSCLLKVIMDGGRIKRIETDDLGDDVYGRHQARACLRGRSLHTRAYSPDRLKFPMKRVGKRGEGRFARISWDEALDETHERLSAVIKKYGNAAIYHRQGYNLPNAPYHYVPRFLNAVGGFLDVYNNYSQAQIMEAAFFTYGKTGHFHGSGSTEMARSDLIVYFGNNPAVTRMSGAGDTYNYQIAKNASRARTIIIDPYYSETACGREDLWIPIRPGTDGAMAEAMAYVLITENRVDEAFLKTYCYGYDAELGDETKGVPPLSAQDGYRAYILGENAGGRPKTPEWAASICGVPAKIIVQLAREMANARAPFITQGTGPQRQAAGEQTSRAIFMLPALLGKIGLPGTNSGACDYLFPESKIANLPQGKNPVKPKISVFTWTDAVVRGQKMTALADGIRGADRLGTDVKCLFMYQHNYLNQHSDANKTARILADESKLEFIFDMDNFMTPSAKFADILLPDITWLENSRIVSFATHTTYVERAIEPMYECRHPYDVFTDLARRFGVEKQFTEGRAWDQWLDHLYAKSREKYPELPELSELKEKKTIRMPFDPAAPRFAFKKFREDPEANPLTTESGKIQIYSHKLKKLKDTWTLPDGDVISPLPQYTATWEGYEDIKTRGKYPLQLFGFKSRARPHSNFYNVPWMREVVEDAVLMNPIDAAARGLRSGQMVYVFNDRGKVRAPIKITPRMMPGVVVIAEGTWYAPDKDGIDQGFCINTLTSQRPTALGKANPQHTNLVEIVAA